MDDNLDRTMRFEYEFEPSSKSASTIVTVFDGTTGPVELDLEDYRKDSISFGRDKGNDIIIRSKYVSRQHGFFRLIDGAWVIEENPSSTNGLLYNGTRISGKVLEEGDNIRIDSSAATSPDGVLIIFSSDSKAGWQTFYLTERHEIFIGRDSGCDIKLDHISVSKYHAKIALMDGAYYLIDNNSTNGVTVNGKRVTKPVRLFEKDLIVITNSKLIFQAKMISFYCYKSGISVESIGIVKRVDKNKIICDGVDLRIEPGELMTIVGGSGAGKTTVMNCLSGNSQPTYGGVFVNNLDLYENFDTLKSIIGFVPQSDIVYENLSVYDMLKYTAQLRLPKDMVESERINCINSVIETVELTANKTTLIKNLSGGQRKRASIAVELLSDPNLLFLDEPASGLDPGVERNLMLTLRKMASGGKTIIFVTHSTLNLHLCDKIAFMGRGGKLCFYGSFNEALKFFGVDDVVDIYNLIAYDSEIWEAKYKSVQKNTGQARMSDPITKSKDKGWLFGSMVLCRRNLHILMNDRIRLLLILAQAPLLAMLIALVADGYQFEQHGMTRNLLFALSCSAFWVGIMNSIQEVCKERNILKREYMAGLGLDSYLFSKLVVLSIVCIVQSFMLISVFSLLIGLPASGVFIGAYFEYLIATFLIMLSASATGLFVSSFFTNADRAMTVAPLLLMPQLLFSGMIFDLAGVTDIISHAVTTRWAMMSYGTIADLNNLPMYNDGIRIPLEYSSFYTHTTNNLLTTWIVMAATVAIFLISAVLVLRNINNERK